MNEQHRVFGSDVVKTGVFQSLEHYIMAIQVERKCDRVEALADGVKLLEELLHILKEDIGDHNAPKV
jgi:hypothetical protein